MLRLEVSQSEGQQIQGDPEGRESMLKRIEEHEVTQLRFLVFRNWRSLI